MTDRGGWWYTIASVSLIGMTFGLEETGVSTKSEISRQLLSVESYSLLPVSEIKGLGDSV